MPEKRTIEKARRAKRSGKSATTQAGEFVREEIHHVREGKHGARSARQAIAIGLAKARRAGVRLPAPPKSASAATKRSAKAASRAATRRRQPSAKRGRAALEALKDEPRRSTSHDALARQARSAARRRSAASRRRAAAKAVRTKGQAARRAAARKERRARLAR
jgi:hypothetical protein